MKFDITDFNGVYSDMFECLGEEITRRISMNYKGQQITFPMRLYSKSYVMRYLERECNKKSIKELSRELGYSERWVKKLMDKVQNKNS